MDGAFFPPDRESWRGEQLARLARVVPSCLISFAGLYSFIDTGDRLLTQQNLRVVVQRLDILLKIGGRLRVLCQDTSDAPKRGRRTGTQVQYEIACVCPDCYRLVSRERGVLEFEKLAAGRSWCFDAPEFSLGYITDAKDTSVMVRTLTELSSSSSGVTEVLIAGPEAQLAHIKERFPIVRLVGDYRHDDVRAPINCKKGLIIDAAGARNLVLSHDRFFFDRVFWERLRLYGDYFDFYNRRHCGLTQIPNEVEVAGGYGYHRLPVSAFSYDKRSGFGEREHTNCHYYNNGGLYIGKLFWFRQGRWPRYLHWGDLEDVHFTQRCELDGAVWSHDWENRVFTTTKRMSVVRTPRFDQRARLWIRNVVARASFRLKFGEDEVR